MSSQISKVIKEKDENNLNSMIEKVIKKIGKEVKIVGKAGKQIKNFDKIKSELSH